MTEVFPPDADLNALSGTTDGEQEVPFIATGESPYYTSFYKMLYRLLDVARRAGDLRVFKDGDLTFGVRAGAFQDGDTIREFAGGEGQALTNNQTNYIYLTADGALATHTAGFPDPSATPHIPLATIVAAVGAFDRGDITDYRGRSLLSLAHGLTAANANEVQRGSQLTIGRPTQRLTTMSEMIECLGNT